MFKLDFDVELMESVFKTEIETHGLVSDAMIDLFRKQMHTELDVTMDQFVCGIQPVEYEIECTVVRHADLLLSGGPIQGEYSSCTNGVDWTETYAKILELPKSMLRSFDFDQFKGNQFGSKELNQHEFNKILDWLKYKYCGMYEFELVEYSENEYIQKWRNREPQPRIH